MMPNQGVVPPKGNDKNAGQLAAVRRRLEKSQKGGNKPEASSFSRNK